MSRALPPINPGEFAKLPYVQHVPTDGRRVFLLPYREPGADFKIPILVDGNVILMKGIPVEASYIAIDRDRPEDYESPLLSTIVRHLSFPALHEPYGKVESDLMNLGAALAKYHLFLDHSRTHRDLAWSAILGSEFEYLLMNNRAMYDQVQFLVKGFWGMVRQFDGARLKKVPELPTSFNDLAKMPFPDLREKYLFPEPLAEFIVRAAPTFALIRDLRVGIEHHGHEAKNFYVMDDGFAVPVAAAPWSRFAVWDEQLLKPNRLGSYLVVLSWLVRETVQLLAGLDEAIRTAAMLPAPPVTDWKVFVRSPSLVHVGRAEDYLMAPWIPWPGPAA